MNKKQRLTVLMGLLFLVNLTLANAEQNKVTTVIEKIAENQWRVTYLSEYPVDRLVFMRSPDASRITRWTPMSKNLEIILKNDVEIITSTNSTSFTQASFELTPTYINLPKDYSPFSPFSDGSMLFHSGRFFVCANQCNEEDNHFLIKVRASENEKIVANGELWNKEALWVDSNSGQKIYVGALPILESENVYAVIDPGLPDSLKSSLQTQLPKMMAYFADRLSPLDDKPMLFASHKDRPDNETGHQGGTLPNQIFMHWYGEKSIKNIREGEILWFFAHEVAHLYQGEAANIDGNENHWIHEGAAEYMAFLALNEFGDAAQGFAKRKLKHQISSCIQDTNNRSVNEWLNDGYYPILYQCGSLIWQVLETEYRQQLSNTDAFEIWKHYQQQASKSEAGIESFLKTHKANISAETYHVLSRFPQAKVNEFMAILAQP
ncbi:M1 family metallopeptidase [Aliiglaciecola sp. M165]|uniref:M1 family metallopeptidase n=1 Tax=Aliiglaciecola sp. M165 TaxID=2593649 RepID=UPI0011809CFA|nr:M1 family metallopeptidase [Aliiglaciecola sp. M165]TRY28789.1 M1 family metallopeptidase [Aliiglaciecola sp. M165]